MWKPSNVKKKISFGDIGASYKCLYKKYEFKKKTLKKIFLICLMCSRYVVKTSVLFKEQEK